MATRSADDWLENSPAAQSVRDDRAAAEVAAISAANAQSSALTLVGSAAFLNTKGVRVYDASGATFTAKLAAAQEELKTRGSGYLYLRSTDSFALDAGARLVAGSQAVDFDGALLDATGLASGIAVEIVPDAPDARTSQMPVAGLRLEGVDDGTGTLSLLKIGRPGDMDGGNTAHLALHEPVLTGGRDGLVLGAQTWCNTLINPKINRQHRRGISWEFGNANAGEQLRVFGGVIHDQVRAAGDAYDAVAFYCAQAATAHFYGTSFDYADYLFHILAGEILFSGCHFENNRDRPMGRIEATPAYENSRVAIHGGIMTGGPHGSGPVEPTLGRAAFIDIAGTRSALLIRDMAWPRYGKPDSALYVVSEGAPMLDVQGVDPNVQANVVPRIGTNTMRLRNGGFEAGYANWRLVAGTNHVRNGAMIGAAAGSPGTLPNGWAVLGALNGLTRTLAVEYVDGLPALVLSLAGTPSAGGTYGVYTEASTAIAAAQGQTWDYGAKIAVRKATGVNVGIGLIERSAAGANVASGSADAGLSPVRKAKKASRTLTAGTAAFAQPSVYFGYTNGVPVDAQIVIDTPLLQLAGSQADDLVNEAHDAAVPGTRWALDTAIKRSGAQSLRLDGTGADVEWYQDMPLGLSKRALFRAYARVASYSGGLVALRVRWLDATGAEISNEPIGGQNLALAGLSANTDWTQRGDTKSAPAGAVTARICLYAQAFSGQVWWDDVEAWAL